MKMRTPVRDRPNRQKTPEERARALIRNLRKRVKVRARFDVFDLGDGREKQICRTCGHVMYYTHEGTYSPVHKMLIAYRAHSNGVSGVCPKCTKKVAAERYPFPEDRFPKSKG